MNADDKNERALDLALGVGDAADEAEAQRDRQLDAARRAWDRRLARLAAAAPPEPAPPGLWARLVATLDSSPPPLPGAITVRAGDGDWEPLVDGVQIRLLACDPARRRRCFLLRMAPGAVLPRHEHSDAEECLMLEGDIAFGELELKAGDFQYLPSGVTHPAGITRAGCVAYVSGPF